MSKPVTAKITVALRPWSAPNFATRPSGEGEGIPVAELSEEALEELAERWLQDLYRKAGRSQMPFTVGQGWSVVK